MTLTFYRFNHHRYWAFNQMFWGPGIVSRADGVVFAKLLGCGGKDGFSILPDFNLYCHLVVWESRDAADQYFDAHPYHQKFMARCAECTIYTLRPVHGHGVWDGRSPFEFQEPVEDTPWAVLTRATIRTRKVLEFWSRVPKVSQMIAGSPGMQYSVGIGEWPIIQQATFSIWENADAIQKFAYSKGHHRNVIKMTKLRKWYKEEMFVRFNVMGKKVLAGAKAMRTPLLPQSVS